MSYKSKRRELPKSPFRIAMDAMLRHDEALRVNLKLKPVTWSTVLLVQPTPEGLDKLNRRRELVLENYQALENYIDRHESAENPARRDYAIYLARQYGRYLAQIDDTMNDVLGHIKKVSEDAYREALAKGSKGVLYADSLQENDNE